MYICELPDAVQDFIYEKLINAGINGEDLELAMNSKFTDLEDIIEI